LFLKFQTRAFASKQRYFGHDLSDQMNQEYFGAPASTAQPRYLGVSPYNFPKLGHHVDALIAGEGRSEAGLELRNRGETGANSDLCSNCKVAGDLTKLPAADGSIPLVIGKHMPWHNLHSMERYAEAKVWLLEVKRVLSKDGVAVFTLPGNQKFMKLPGSGDPFFDPASVARTLGFRVRRYEGPNGVGMILDLPPDYENAPKRNGSGVLKGDKVVMPLEFVPVK
jgi:hypothetical protein